LVRPARLIWPDGAERQVNEMSVSISFNDDVRGAQPQRRANADTPPAASKNGVATQQSDPSPSVGAASEGAGLISYLVLTALALACAGLRALIFWPSF